MSVVCLQTMNVVRKRNAKGEKQNESDDGVLLSWRSTHFAISLSPTLIARWLFRDKGVCTTPNTKCINAMAPANHRQ